MFGILPNLTGNISVDVAVCRKPCMWQLSDNFVSCLYSDVCIAFPRHCPSGTFYLLLYTCIQNISLLCCLELMQKLLSLWFPVQPNSFAAELDCDNFHH